MILNPTVQHRAKHFNLLLARELSLIERAHMQNLTIHQKLENSIRRANHQSSGINRTKVSIHFDHIYNEETDSIDYSKLRGNDQNNNLSTKRRLSIGACSSASQNQSAVDQLDEFSDDSICYNPLRRRRFCTKAQRLPPIVKATGSNRPKREIRNTQWMPNLPSPNKSRDSNTKPMSVTSDESSKITLPELTPIQRQVRSFLESLPTYKGAQHGFDSFAPASLYTNRAPLAIR